MRKITDFGNKIGGARKDIWKEDGITEESLYEMNEDEKRNYVNRDNVWPLPDAKKLVSIENVEPFVAYWQRQARLTVTKEPVIYQADDFNEAITKYVREVRFLKSVVMQCKTLEDVMQTEKTFRYWIENRTAKFCKDAPISEKVVSVRGLFRLSYNHGSFRSYVNRTGFPFVQRNVSMHRNRKKTFLPPQLEHIEREGTDYRHSLHVTPEWWQKEFSFYGVEFGNWTSQKDRQISMDYCFDALKDLASVLQIECKDIAFSGRLSLAFGARGVSNASAHYELLRKVINLTKMHGAGLTAHEWFHALDHYIGSYFQVPDGKLASETNYKNLLPDSFNRLIHALKYDTNGNKTDYLRGSSEFDKHYIKDTFGYWGSDAEMAARAFACYIKDCLGHKSDYLIAHADVYEFEYDNMRLCAIPQGEERELFNELFDQLIYDLKKIGVLHQAEKKVAEIPCVAEKTIYYCDYKSNLLEEYSGQFCFKL